MGMHIGLIATKGQVSQLRDAFLRVWPQFEVVAINDKLSNAKAMWDWKDTHAEFVSAANWTKENPGKEVYLFWQDGPWAVLLDESYVLASDEEALAKLSGLTDTVLSFVVETASGTAAFVCFEAGSLRRRILSEDGNVVTEGDPLPQEAGIDIENYYMEESEALLKALGMSGYEQIPTSVGCQAVCVVDRTDYGQL